MNSAIEPDDIRWLVSPTAESYLTRFQHDQGSLVRRVDSLRGELSATRAHLILEQVELRTRAAAKFRHAEELFFDRLALEQATDDVTAAYKAERFPQGETVADLCCGIGGDLMALAGQGSVIGIDRNESLAILAQANGEKLRALGAIEETSQVELRTSDASQFDLSEVAAWHIDPDRRPQGKRTTRIELHEPGSEAWAELLRQNPNGAIKLAPAAELPDSWQGESEMEWISRDGSCRQLVLWRGELANSPGLRRATVLNGSSGVRRSVAGKPDIVPQSSAVGRFLFEPDAAVLAAELVGVLAAEHQLEALIPGGGYLTGDQPVADPALAAFEVWEVLPFQLKRIKQLVRTRGIGELEIKKRGVTQDPAMLRQQLKTSGDKSATLLLTRLPEGITAILAQRMARR